MDWSTYNAALPTVGVVNALGALIGLWVVYAIAQHMRRRAHCTPLASPPNPSFLFGIGRSLFKHPDPAVVYEQWAEKYGSVFRIPATLGYSRVVLCDPKAIQHFYSHETFLYQQTTLTKQSIESLVRILTYLLVGRGRACCRSGGVCCGRKGKATRGDIRLISVGDLLTALPNRQRKALTPAFSNAAIRRLTYIFFDSAYKVGAYFQLSRTASSLTLHACRSRRLGTASSQLKEMIPPLSRCRLGKCRHIFCANSKLNVRRMNHVSCVFLQSIAGLTPLLQWMTLMNVP